MAGSNVNLAFIGEAIDRLITVPMSNWTILKGLPLMKLYQFAREKTGEPLSLKAAKMIKKAVNTGDYVLILSGFVISNFMLPETDGPVGAAALARALDLGLGAIPVVLTEDINKVTFNKTCNAAGLIVCDSKQVRTGGRGRKMEVRSFPIDHDEAHKEAIKILDELKPKVIIAIERPGWNAKKVHHSGAGFDISDITAKTDYVFLEAQKRKIITIGIGDLGNELGMGFIKEAILKHIPLAEKCLCNCNSGIASDVSSDIGIICNISNWGAYGVEACLAALCGELEVMHDTKTEKNMIRECVRAGGIDPVSGLLRPYVDGDSEDIHACIIEMLRSIVKHATTESIFTSEYRSTWNDKTN